MPEAQSDIDYTVDIGRHEMTFRANTPKGEEFLGGVDLTMSNEEAHTFRQHARAARLTVNRFSNAFANTIIHKGARLQHHTIPVQCRGSRATHL